MFSKALFINLILISLILLGTWYTWLQITRPVNVITPRHSPDAFATQVIVFHTDDEGNLYDQLKTPLSVHYPFDDSLSLSKPLFDLFLKNNESWELSAQYGKLKKNDFLYLWDNVILKQKKISTYPNSILTTSTLDVDLNKKTANTSAPVTITQANQTINAIGMHADFNTKTIKLLSQVKGQLKPSKNK